MSNASRKKQSGHSGKFNAFIIPMIVILGILPLIIHLKIYDTNLEDQAYFLEETYPDIFLYYDVGVKTPLQRYRIIAH